jgi:hypothetical protein
MGFSAIIPIEVAAAANAALEVQGFGAGNFSVPLRSDPTDTEASHAALNMLAEIPGFREAVAALPGVSILDAPPGTVAFDQHVEQEVLDWTDPTNWTENPVMTGDQRTFNGKLWVSLVDFNVWQPPTNWREVPSDGYPAWVQPTGATDAYEKGDRVTHNSKNWRSTLDANVWEPGVFGWEEIPARRKRK